MFKGSAKYYLSKLTETDLKRFLYKRLPFYLVGLFILIVFGVKGLVITFFLVLSFVFGWIAKGVINVVKDYRLAQRLNKVHYTTLEYESLQKQNRALYEAVKAYQEGAVGGRGASGVGRPPSSPSRPRMDHQQIQEIIAQMEVNHD